jgi:multiple sugar transport system permease protein
VRRVRSWRDALTLIGFLAPALVLLGVFTIWPAVWAVYQSFTNKALTGFEARAPRFVGLQNYARLLDDPGFHSSMLRTFVFVLLSAVFLLPLAVPEAVAALLWASTANGTREGLLNRGLGLVGVGPVEWLQRHAFETVTVVNIWRGIPFAMVLFAAAIESIPRTTLEAGLIDGASPTQQLRRIVLPILRPQILTFLMLTTITTFGIFGLVFFLTRGGPGNVTEIIGIYIYQRAFAFFQIGLGSAAGVLLLLVLLVLGAYYVWLMRDQA